MGFNWTEAVIIGLTFLLGIIGFQAIELHMVNKSAEFYKTQLQVLEDESKNVQDHYVEAQKEASLEMQDAQNKINELMKQKVPSQCDQVIQWGLDQAKGF